MNKQNLLIVLFRSPFPLLSGDQIRMYQNIRILSKYFNVDVLFLTDKEVEYKTIGGVTKYAKNVYPFSFKKHQYIFNTLRGFFKKEPLQVSYFYSREVQKWVDKNINNYQYVFCHTIRTTKYVRNYKNIFKIVDLVDAISMNYEKAFASKRVGFWKILYYIDKHRLKGYEQKIVNTFNKTIIISDVDKQYILKRGVMKNIKVIPNCIFSDFLKSEKTVIEENKISFIGKMDYEPNKTAVLYFVKNVFPKILKKYPNVIFEIVGVRPTDQIKNLSNHKNIRVTGYVESIEKAIQSSKLIVAPMKTGAGIQNKILQSMYLQKCVVTTSIGAEGLSNVTKNEIIIEDGSDEFAQKILFYLENDTLRNSVGIAAKKYIENSFSEEKIDELFKEFLIG